MAGDAALAPADAASQPDDLSGAAALTNAPGLVLARRVPIDAGFRMRLSVVGAALRLRSLALALLFVVGALQTLVDTGLRLTLAPAKLKNLQAVVSIIAGLPLLLAISMSVRDNVFVFGWGSGLARMGDFICRPASPRGRLRRLTRALRRGGAR